MPVKRRLMKKQAHRITPEAVEAFQAGDYLALHRALHLPPWHPSPLPESVTPLGVDPGNPPTDGRGAALDGLWPVAVELQRALQAAVIRRCVDIETVGAEGRGCARNCRSH